MKRSIWIVCLIALLAAATSLCFAQSDREGSKDHPGISRMPGYYIDSYSEEQFNSAKFTVTEKGQQQQEEVEGRLVKLGYYLKQGSPETSTLQVIRNYENAVRAAGGQVLYDASFDSGVRREATLRLTKGGSEIWIGIEARSDNHWLTIIEKQAMQQDVAIDAAAMGSQLATNGKIALYGIYFDTGKSSLKPESDPTLVEIAKMLKQNPRLKVFVVGHTDIVGEPAMNVKLSEARAQSVVNALATKYQIPAARLTPYGNGPYAPVGSNKTEEGRAKNRRVELVEIATE